MCLRGQFPAEPESDSPDQPAESKLLHEVPKLMQSGNPLNNNANHLMAMLAGFLDQPVRANSVKSGSSAQEHNSHGITWNFRFPVGL
jgi:hypothetical protein